MRIDKNLTVIVTGGASGLGEATVKLFRSLEANVVIADLNVDAGQQLAKELGCVFFKTDVSNEDNVKGLFEFAIENYKQVHAVVNCAGIIAAGTIIYSKGVASSDVMNRVLKINVIGTFNMSKWGAKYMSAQEEKDGERGVIINVASVAGFEGQKGQVIYSASKGAIIGMTLPMARDLGKYKIRVMTIAPGIFMTNMGSAVQSKVLEGLAKSTPIGKLGFAPDFALAVKAIVENPYATGDTWRLDGGLRLPFM